MSRFDKFIDIIDEIKVIERTKKGLPPYDLDELRDEIRELNIEIMEMQTNTRMTKRLFPQLKKLLETNPKRLIFQIHRGYVVGVSAQK